MPRPKSYQTAATAGADAADPFSSSDDDSQKDDEEAVLAVRAELRLPHEEAPRVKSFFRDALTARADSFFPSLRR